MAIRRFILLEFSNPKVRKFLTDLRATFERREPRLAAHITVRGPYREIPTAATVERLNEELQGLGVLIGGAGTFDTKDGHAVYLKAQSPLFEELWWKPDYPTHIFGKAPHITVFETEDRRRAKSVEAFLRSERIEIFTFGLRLRVHAEKQLAFADFSFGEDVIGKRAQLDRWRMRPGLLLRARRVVQQWQVSGSE